MKKLFALILILVLTFSLAACGSEPAPAPAPTDGGSEPAPAPTDGGSEKKIRVAAVPQYPPEEWAQTVLNGIRAACAYYGYEVNDFDCNGETDLQNNILQDCIVQGYIEVEYGPVSIGKPPDHPLEDIERDAVESRLFVFSDVGEERGKRQRFFPPQGLERVVHDNPAHPSLQRAFSPVSETVHGPEDLDEGVLEDVLDLFVIGDIAPAYGREVPHVTAVERLDRCGILPDDPAYQVFLRSAISDSDSQRSASMLACSGLYNAKTG